MANNEVWDVDRIAAAELLAALQRAPAEALAAIAEQAFSRHRTESHEWAARRVHQSAVAELDAGARREFDRRDAIWADGYRFAEQCLQACTPNELLGAVTGRSVSRGQVLRRLIRTAKQRTG